jgi:hypothetical protein
LSLLVVELTGFAVEPLCYMQPFDRFSHLLDMLANRNNNSIKILAKWFAVGLLFLLLINLNNIWREIDLANSPIIRIVSQIQYAQQTPVANMVNGILLLPL